MKNFDIIKTYTEKEFAKWIVEYSFENNMKILSTFLEYWKENNIITEEIKNEAIMLLNSSYERTYADSINNWAKMLNEEFIDE